MPDEDHIEQLVSRYLGYWNQADIDGLMYMFDSEMSYHDIPSSDVIKYSDLRQFLSNSFTIETNQHIKLQDSIFIEGNSAFIHWVQSFFIAKTDKQVKVNGVELIVFHDDKIRSIREFYQYQIDGMEESSSATDGTHAEKMAKVGLDNDLIQKIAEEINQYFDEQSPYLEPDLNLTTVSQKLGYTRNQISYVINHVLERTFYDLINGRRIEYVMQQMAISETNPSILEMAINAGFNSVSGFYSAFKKHSGMTPAQYQRSKST